MRVPLSKPYIGKEEEEAVIKVLRSGQLAQGPIVKKFEEGFAKYLGTKYAIAASNGTASLHLALLSSKIKRGDEVITTPFSFISTGNCILYTGARPIFVDIDPETLNINADRIEERITEKTKALLVTHVFGLSCEMRQIVEICKTHRLTLIEDCAEALGSNYERKKVGTFGISCFSFYPNKSITCGEGGMVCTEDREQAELLKSLRNQGRGEERWLRHQILGFNYRMTDLAASIGLTQLKKIDEIQAKRRQVAKKYNKLLKSRLGDKVTLPKFNKERTWFAYIIQTDNRDVASMKLRDDGVETRNYFPCIHLQPYYKRMGYRESQYPIAESASRKALALPFFTSMLDGEIEYVIDILTQALHQQ